MPPKAQFTTAHVMIFPLKLTTSLPLVLKGPIGHPVEFADLGCGRLDVADFGESNNTGDQCLGGYRQERQNNP